MNNYLTSIIKQFQYLKSLGDKTIDRLSFTDLQKEIVKDSNSIAIISKHIAGNMLSRWTNFLTEDGEKEWRHRDQEFIDAFTSKQDIITYWDKGWDCLFEAIKPLKENDLDKIIYIRNEGHTVTEAINRQLSHYSYHVGQIVFLGKLIQENRWESLSIPKGASKHYNKEKFNQDKSKAHFTDNL